MNMHIYDVDEFKSREYDEKCIIFIKAINEDSVLVSFWGGYKSFERKEILGSDIHLDAENDLEYCQEYFNMLSNNYAKIRRKMKDIANTVSKKANSSQKIAIYSSLTRKDDRDERKFQRMLIFFMKTSFESYMSDETEINLYKETLKVEGEYYYLTEVNSGITLPFLAKDYYKHNYYQAFYEAMLYKNINDDVDNPNNDSVNIQEFPQVGDILEQMERVGKKTEKKNQGYINYLNSFFEINAKKNKKSLREFKSEFNSERKSIMPELKNKLERIEIGESLSQNHVLMLYLAYLLRMNYEETKKLFILGGEKFNPRNECEAFFHLLIQEEIYEDDERMEMVLNEIGFVMLEEYVLDFYCKIGKITGQKNKKRKNKNNIEK